jgi:hypothetical protein
LEIAQKCGVVPPIEVEILFVFFSKTKRLERKAGTWLGKCPSHLVLKILKIDFVKIKKGASIETPFCFLEC